MKRKVTPSPLTPQAIWKGLGTAVFGRALYCFPKVASTNDAAMELAAAGASEGTMVTAEVQTRGRGRQGRRWVQTAGKGLAFSIVLRPKLSPDELPEVTLAAAVAVARTFEAFRVRPKIKWPNDILLSGKKVCGILTETGPKKDKMAVVILGIGINLNQTASEFPAELKRSATSLLRATGRKTDRAAFLRKLLMNLEEVYGWLGARRFSKVLFEWRKRSSQLGGQVKVTQAGRVFYGQVLDIDEKGALLVRNDLGMVECIISGDVESLSGEKERGRR